MSFRVFFELMKLLCWSFVQLLFVLVHILNFEIGRNVFKGVKMMKGFCITINQQFLPCALKGLKFFPADEKWGPGIFFFNISKMQNDHRLLNHQCVNPPFIGSD